MKNTKNNGCEICGEMTAIAGRLICPTCDKCWIEVHPHSINWSVCLRESFASLEAQKKSEQFEDAYLREVSRIERLKAEIERLKEDIERLKAEIEAFENPPKPPRHREAAVFHNGRIRFVDIDREGQDGTVKS
ncbi:MAG: hypothetical protein Q8O94_03035 [bacterium]|nr:hypothetical protein [bacterium]